LDFFLSGSGGGASAEEGLIQIPVGQLEPNRHQPRSDFAPEELERLSASIRATGVLQPILVRKPNKKDERYEIIAGERRWRAAQMAGLERIPALVREVSEEMAAVYGLVENLQRADLNAIEKAKAFRQIQTMIRGSQDDVARQVGLDRSTVANFLRLLELPEEVQAHVSRGTLSMGHARALLGLSDPGEQQVLAEAVLKEKLSVRQVEALVQEMNEPSTKGSARKPGRKGERPLWLNEIEETLVEALGTPVHVRYSAKRSRITIECLGRPEFERVYERLKSLGRSA
jgi:ParB family chromosome partitioning protein